MPLISMPMYDIHRPSTAALANTICQLLVKHDVHADVVWPQDLLSHWRDDQLLLSGSCAYPLVKNLPKVQLVGAFHSLAQGCENLRSRSWLVARSADEGRSLSDFRGQRAVCNSEDSHSGFNALRYLIAPLAQQGKFFRQTLFSGSHVASLAALRALQADIAAIDCITWALLRRYQPEALDGLAIVGETPLCAALPLITSANTDALLMEKLRSVLFEITMDEAFHPIMEANLIGGFAVPQRSFYDEVLQFEALPDRQWMGDRGQSAGDSRRESGPPCR